MFRIFSLLIAIAGGAVVMLGWQHGWEPAGWLRALYVQRPLPDAAEVRQLKVKLHAIEAEAKELAEQRHRLHANQETDLKVLDRPDTDPVARKAFDLITTVRDKELDRLEAQLQSKQKAVKEARTNLVASQLEEVRNTLTDHSAPLVKLDAVSQRKEIRLALLRQWDLLREGQVQTLRQCFVEPVRARITVETVCIGKDLFKHEQVADLMYEVVVDEESGKASILTSRGRLFTTLVRQQGRWVGEKVWFE